MSEPKTGVMTKEEARAALKEWRAYQASIKAERMARSKRRAERANQILQHKEAERLAQEEIDSFNRELDANVKSGLDITSKIAVLRVELKQHDEARRKIGSLLDKAYANRKTARDALSALAAEIRGAAVNESEEA